MKHSPLQLFRYVIPEISCSANPAFNPEKPGESALEQLSVNSVATKQKTTEKVVGRSWSVEMTISQKLKDRQNFPYKFDISIIGFFACHDGLPPDADEERFVHINGSSILYGAAREIVRSLTAHGPWGELFLPSVSFYKDISPKQEDSSPPKGEK